MNLLDEKVIILVIFCLTVRNSADWCSFIREIKSKEKFMRLCVLFLFLLVSCRTTGSFAGKALYEKLSLAGVEILVNGQRSGSGAFVSSDGLILTAAHIFQSKADYQMMDAKGTVREVKLIAVDRSSDLALVKADITTPAYLEISEKDIEPAQEIYQFGAAFFRGGMMQKGWVCGGKPMYEFYSGDSRHGVEVRHVSTTVQPGTSGGPWVNLRGEVVGVQSGIMIINKSNSGMSFIAPLAKIKRLVNTRKSAATPTLEITVETLTNQRPPVVKNYGGRTGVVIVGVHKDGTGDKQGLKKDDLILAVNGKDVVFDNDFYRLLRSIPAGTDFELQIRKPGKEGAVKKLKLKASVLEKRFQVGFPE